MKTPPLYEATDTFSGYLSGDAHTFFMNLPRAEKHTWGARIQDGDDDIDSILGEFMDAYGIQAHEGEKRRTQSPQIERADMRQGEGTTTQRVFQTNLA